MYNWIIEFIDIHDILYDLQFEFRIHNSTSVALPLLCDRISQALHDGNYVLGVFLDFSTAFETVNHDILLRRPYALGIKGTAHDWIKSNLSDHDQFVVFHNTQSTKYYHMWCPTRVDSWPIVTSIVHKWSGRCVSCSLFDFICWQYNVFLNGNYVDGMRRTMIN